LPRELSLHRALQRDSCLDVPVPVPVPVPDLLLGKPELGTGAKSPSVKVDHAS
jgi:hypothetical protein